MKKVGTVKSTKVTLKVKKTAKITAVKKGKCYIYVYAQNGTYTRVTVTVK